jgi:hypothetical protein
LSSHSFIIRLVEAALCFVIVILLRIAIVYLSPRLGAIWIGTPILIFPLLAVAWPHAQPNSGPRIDGHRRVDHARPLVDATAIQFHRTSGRRHDGDRLGFYIVGALPV